MLVREKRQKEKEVRNRRGPNFCFITHTQIVGFERLREKGREGERTWHIQSKDKIEEKEIK